MTIKGSELEKINYLNVSYYGDDKGKFSLSDSDLEYFKNLTFTRKGGIHPGNTPDYYIKLISDNNEYFAIYNENSRSDKVFFLLGHHDEYGFFNTPAPGGWNDPVYFVEASEELLKILHIK